MGFRAVVRHTLAKIVAQWFRLFALHHFRDHRHVVALFVRHARGGEIHVHPVHLFFGQLGQIVTHAMLLTYFAVLNLRRR